MVRLTEQCAVVASMVVLCGLLVMPGWAQAQTAAPTAQSATPHAAAVQATSKATRQDRSGKKSSKAGPVPEVSEAPAPPPTLEQMAPVAPEVSYKSGQLTIESKNATLAQVLRSVQAKTGASFEIPASAANDRVVAQLGPGPPRDILATLLNGSKYDYIILGIPNQPGAVQKLILKVRQNMPMTNTAENRPVRAQPQEEPQDEEYTPPEPSQYDSAVENQNVPPPPGSYRPGAFIPNRGPQNPEFPSQNPPVDEQAPRNGVKTPEQLLQELQRMRQQQEMYQQQLNPANRNLPPYSQQQQEEQ